MFYELTLATALFLLAASFFAGFVDSIAGGGGLIQLPALLIGLPKSGTAEVLGTNKLSAVFGTTTAAALYRKQIKPDPKILLGMGIPAFLGSAGGAVLASKIPTNSMRPMVLVLLVAVPLVLGMTWGIQSVLRRHMSNNMHLQADLHGTLIEAVEGAAPAYRGCAYVVFEDLPLDPFGNRLPQLSFEVFRPIADPDSAEGLIRRIDGSHSGVVGLPLSDTRLLLIVAGWRP